MWFRGELVELRQRDALGCLVNVGVDLLGADGLGADDIQRSSGPYSSAMSGQPG